MRQYLLLSLITVFCLTSCEKAERPIDLPAEGSASHATIDMGEDYKDMYFFDLATNKVVYTSEINSWDIAFESSVLGYHMFMNDPKWKLYNTHKTDLKAVTDADCPGKSTEWRNDGPCGLPDSTAAGEWKTDRNAPTSKMEVYILKSTDYGTYKVQLLTATDTRYTLQYADINDVDGNYTSKAIEKNSQTSLTYLSFTDGVLPIEPPKGTWDIVFTRYTHIYYDLGGTPYPVVGPLLNMYNTTAARDTISPGYDNIKSAVISQLKFTNFRDLIGFSWKSYDLNTNRYTVNKNRCYIIKTRNDEYYKLHFLDFYSNTGMKGSPSFEFERLY